MELQSLRTFQAVVEEGGVLSASRKLNTVQSNVTARIKKLEDDLGTELFHRKGRGLELAPSGRVLLDYSRQMLQLASQADLAVRQVGEQTGELRIGAMETYTAMKLPTALIRLRRAHPGLGLHVHTATSAELVRQVLDFQLDCAFVGGPLEHLDLKITEVAREELVLLRAKNAVASKAPLILFREGCAYRARALTWQRESGDPRQEVMEFGTLEGILGCVAAGLGCTLMPRWVLDGNRYADELVIETVAPHIAEVPTLLIRQRSAEGLMALDTLEAAVTSEQVAAT